jgi:transposase-like protein
MDEVVVGWQAAAAASRRTESWLRRHPDLTGGRKNDDGNWEFPVAALERLRPEGVADTVEPDADVRAADDDDDVEGVSIKSGTSEPDDDEVVRIRTEPAVPSTNATPPTEAVQMVPVATVADEHGITGEMYAVVFEALDGGMRISEIVRQHKLLPQIAEVIVAAWRHVNEIDLNGPAVPAVVARQEKRLATQEARIVELEKYIAEVVEVHNALADTVDPQGGADATAPAVEHVDLPARVAELASAVDEIREFLAGFVPAVMLRRDIASVVRDKPLLLLPVTLRRMFAMPVPPGTCDYYES